MSSKTFEANQAGCAKMIRHMAGLCLLFLPLISRAADEAVTATNQIVPRVVVDYSKAPECEAFATRSGELVQKWYPRIRELLASDEQEPPPPTITLTFLSMKGVAATSGAHIRVSAEWVTKRNTNDFGMVIHELTHIVQNYHGAGEGWLTEGIADYVRHRYFEPGILKPRITTETSYRDGYKTTAAFLIWLSENKDADIVKKLNAASREKKDVRPVFQAATGAALDDLWNEFADAFRKKKSEPVSKTQ